MLKIPAMKESGNYHVSKNTTIRLEMNALQSYKDYCDDSEKEDRLPLACSLFSFLSRR